MVADDYAAVTPSLVKLVSPKFTPLWDPQLGKHLEECGHAVFEEQVLDSLMRDLLEPSEFAK